MRYTKWAKDCSVDFGDDEAHHRPSIFSSERFLESV